MGRIHDVRNRRLMLLPAAIACAVVLFTIALSGIVPPEAQAQNYNTRNLIRNLIKIGYPLDRTDIIALDNIGMRFDTKNRIDVLQKILKDRDAIHARTRFDYFTRTETICDALRLLDEHDLPVANRLIDNLNQQSGWENREKALLAFMAARRGFRYEQNRDFLLRVLPQYDGNADPTQAVEASQAIIDIMNFLSYLADLFAYRQDETILQALFDYSTNAYGFPAEYLSHMFVDMFLTAPKVFVSHLASRREEEQNSIIISMAFGIRNNQIREKVKQALEPGLFDTDPANRDSVNRIISRLKEQIESAAGQKTGMPPRATSDKNR